jgi:hypothetical protein
MLVAFACGPPHGSANVSITRRTRGSFLDEIISLVLYYYLSIWRYVYKGFISFLSQPTTRLPAQKNFFRMLIENQCQANLLLYPEPCICLAWSYCAFGLQDTNSGQASGGQSPVSSAVPHITTEEHR